MITIPVVTERCAGIDVGKRGLAVARLTSPAGKEGLDRDSMVRDHGSGTGVVEELDNGGGSHYSSDGKHGLILDSSEERAGERPACRAGLLKEVCRGCGTDAESGSERGCGTKPRRTERRRRNGCSPTEAGLAEESATRRTVESEEPTKSISLPGSRSKVCRGKPGFRARQTKNQYSDARESPWRGYSADSAENRDTPAQRRKRKKSNAEPSTRARSRRNIFEAKGRT